MFILYIFLSFQAFAGYAIGTEAEEGQINQNGVIMIPGVDNKADEDPSKPCLTEANELHEACSTSQSRVVTALEAETRAKDAAANAEAAKKTSEAIKTCDENCSPTRARNKLNRCVPANTKVVEDLVADFKKIYERRKCKGQAGSDEEQAESAPVAEAAPANPFPELPERITSLEALNMAKTKCPANNTLACVEEADRRYAVYQQYLEESDNCRGRGICEDIALQRLTQDRIVVPEEDKPGIVNADLANGTVLEDLIKQGRAPKAAFEFSTTNNPTALRQWASNSRVMRVACWPKSGGFVCEESYPKGVKRFSYKTLDKTSHPSERVMISHIQSQDSACKYGGVCTGSPYDRAPTTCDSFTCTSCIPYISIQSCRIQTRMGTTEYYYKDAQGRFHTNSADALNARVEPPARPVVASIPPSYDPTKVAPMPMQMPAEIAVQRERYRLNQEYRACNGNLSCEVRVEQKIQRFVATNPGGTTGGGGGNVVGGGNTVGGGGGNTVGGSGNTVGGGSNPNGGTNNNGGNVGGGSTTSNTQNQIVQQPQQQQNQQQQQQNPANSSPMSVASNNTSSFPNFVPQSQKKNESAKEQTIGPSLADTSGLKKTPGGMSGNLDNGSGALASSVVAQNPTPQGGRQISSVNPITPSSGMGALSPGNAALAVAAEGEKPKAPLLPSQQNNAFYGSGGNAAGVAGTGGFASNAVTKNKVAKGKSSLLNKNKSSSCAPGDFCFFNRVQRGLASLTGRRLKGDLNSSSDGPSGFRGGPQPIFDDVRLFGLSVDQSGDLQVSSKFVDAP